jgi:hypothetical protein
VRIKTFRLTYLKGKIIILNSNRMATILPMVLNIREYVFFSDHTSVFRTSLTIKSHYFPKQSCRLLFVTDIQYVFFERGTEFRTLFRQTSKLQKVLCNLTKMIQTVSRKSLMKSVSGSVTVHIQVNCLLVAYLTTISVAQATQSCS